MSTDKILDKRGDFVLAYRPYAFQPYVTWKVDRQDGGYYWGHYFGDLDDARKDLKTRS